MSEPRKIPAKELPVPRLELVWEPISKDDCWNNWQCMLNLVFQHTLGQIIRIRCGMTRSCRPKPPDFYPEFDTPFRDGVHCMDMSGQLRLPAYVVVGEVAQFVQPLFRHIEISGESEVWNAKEIEAGFEPKTGPEPGESNR